jgi:hypothetical protein
MLNVTGAHGHDQYFAPGKPSLTSIADVVAGSP